MPVEDDHGRLAGLLSFRDLLRLVATGGEPTAEVSVREIMRKDPLTVRPSTPTLEALSMMRERYIGSLPVVNEDGRLEGLITVYDLLEIAGKHPKVLADPEPTAFFLGFGDSCLDFELELHGQVGRFEPGYDLRLFAPHDIHGWFRIYPQLELL